MRFANKLKTRPFGAFAATAVLGAFVVLPAAVHAQVTIKAYISGPNSQFAPSTITNKVAENFDSQALSTGSTPTTYSSAIGTYNGQYAILADDNFGNGTNNYFAFGNRNSSSTPVTLTFTNAIQYFGLSYDAGDANNGLSFYDATDKLIGRYSTSQLISALQGGAAGTKVTAENGTKYDTSFFYGKPTGGAIGTAQSATINHSEPSAFLNFFISGGTVKKVVFDNNGNSTTTGFESDNHTISTVAQSATGDFVYVGSTDSPEASTFALLAAGLPVLIGGIGAKNSFAQRSRKCAK